MATISNTPRPGYVWDSTDNVWYPIGVGGHSHSEIAKTIADAKGDLIVGTAADTVDRLAVGTNNHTLIADSAEATGLKYAAGSKATLTTTGDILYASAANTPARLGIGSTSQVLTVTGGVPVWATPASGSTFVGASAYTTATITAASATWTAITYNSEYFDTDAIHSTSSNTSRFTIPAGKTGKWLCSFNVQFIGTSSTANVFVEIYKNGSAVAFSKLVCVGGAGAMNFPFSQVLDLTAADYIEFYVYQNSGISRDFYSDNSLGGAGFGQVSYLGA